MLEVTSPGVDRPLTEPRHWRRNVGRLVTVAVGPSGAADEVTGRVTDVDDDGVTLAVEARSSRARRSGRRPRGWSAGRELGAGRVQVEFGRVEQDSDDDRTGRRPGRGHLFRGGEQ